MNKRNLLLAVVVMVLSLAITGCGGGGGTTEIKAVLMNRYAGLHHCYENRDIVGYMSYYSPNYLAHYDEVKDEYREYMVDQSCGLEMNYAELEDYWTGVITLMEWANQEFIAQDIQWDFESNVVDLRIVTLTNTLAVTEVTYFQTSTYVDKDDNVTTDPVYTYTEKVTWAKENGTWVIVSETVPD